MARYRTRVSGPLLEILKVARTIADLEGAKEVGDHHVAEAIPYRTLDRRRCV